MSRLVSIPAFISYQTLLLPTNQVQVRFRYVCPIRLSIGTGSQSGAGDKQSNFARALRPRQRPV